MPKYTWTVNNTTQTENITEFVRSLSFSYGRPSPVSPYSGNTGLMVLTNTDNEYKLANVNDTIVISVSPNAFGFTQTADVATFTVISRQFNDEPGSGNNSTVTVMLQDAFINAGNVNFNSQSLVSVNDQISEIVALLPNQLSINANNTDVAISTGTFTVNANQRINQIVAGDRGLMRSTNNAFTSYEYEYRAPSQFSPQIGVSTVLTFGRTASASQIAYQTISRSEASSNGLLYNSATITGSATTATKTDSASITTYGLRAFTATTAQSDLVDETAEWYANAFSDPNTITLKMSFLDVAQNNTALGLFSADLLGDGKFYTVSYTPPADFEVTGVYWPEQITVNATPESTLFEITFTPQTYYANFILDDAVWGVLDTDRLGV
jgi:hypothetical protein